MAETKTYSGLIAEHDYDELGAVLFLSDHTMPLAEMLIADIANRTVTARYWITGRRVTKEEAREAFVRTLLGQADVEFVARYSETTGYLWTDEECRIGGHNLLDELRGHIGKWLILEVEIHEVHT